MGLRLLVFSFLFLLVLGFEHFMAAKNGRFGELLAASQFSDQADVPVFAFVALERPVNRFAFLNINNDHIVKFWRAPELLIFMERAQERIIAFIFSRQAGKVITYRVAVQGGIAGGGGARLLLRLSASSSYQRL